MDRIGVDWRGPGNVWVRTPTGWTVRRPEADEDRLEEEERGESLQPVHKSRQSVPNNASAWSAPTARYIGVQGRKGQRQVSTCLSDALMILDFKEAAANMGKFRYLKELMYVLMTDYITKASGTAQRQLLLILDLMVNTAVQREHNIVAVRSLVRDTLDKMAGTHQFGHLGCTSMWKRHIQSVSNLKIKLDNFRYTEREEDDKPTLMDLPKECIRHIMMFLSDPKDLLNLGSANEELYYMSRDPSLWQKLTNTHFSEKQMMTYIDGDHSDGVDWMDVFPKCFKKFGLRKFYTDTLVVCTGCKSLFWRYQLHVCYRNNDVNVYQPLPVLEEVDVDEFLQIFKLF